MITMYGIANCDTIKKARTCLERKGVEYRFHDYKKEGIDAATLKHWCKDFPLDELINKRGTTWRKLDDAAKENLNEDRAIRLMMDNPSLIKRPMLETGRERILGFDQARYEALRP